MKEKSVLMLTIAITLIIALTYFSACAKEAAPVAREVEEPKGEIVIGILEDMSGIMGGTGTHYVAGETDAIRYINEELGGVNGHHISAIIIDYKFDATLAMSGWDRLKNANVPVVMGFMAGAVPILHQASDVDHIPMVVSLLTIDRLFPNENEPSYQFATASSTASIPDYYIYTIEKEWRTEEKGRPPKVGFDSVNIGASPAVIKKKARMECEKRGWEYIVTTTSGAPTDATTQVLQMMNFGVDYIYQMPTEQQAIVWQKELSRAKFHPRFYGVGTVGSSEIWNAVGEECIGVNSAEQLSTWWDTDVPGIKLLHELNAKWHPDVKSCPVHYIKGFSAQLMVAETLRRALNDVGYENINGEAVHEAMETLRDYDPLETGVGYTYTSTDHQGLHKIKWYAWTKDGTKVATSKEWYIPPPLPEEQQRDAWWYKD
jgi:branched-chain amino acid transport system substrate-binding protein